MIFYLELFGFLFESLLIYCELFGDLRPRLTRQNMLQLGVQLLLLLYEQLFLNDLLGLGNESLLECVYFLNELERARIASLEFAPSMHVHRVLELLLERLATRALLEQLALHVKYLLAQIVHVGHSIRQVLFLASQSLDLQLEYANVLDARFILHLALVQRRLLDLDLLVQQGQLVIATHQLCAQDVALLNHLFELFLLSHAFAVRFLDDLEEFALFGLLCVDVRLVLARLFLQLHKFGLQVLFFFLDLLERTMF